MMFHVTGARHRALKGLGNLTVGMALCNAAWADQPAATTPSKADGRTSEAGISQILVVGKRSLDVDIARSRDDIQPYVVFDAEQIAQSGAQNIEAFLHTYLPMNAQRNSSAQLGPQVSPQGGIDLRGLGSDQTLILVDGRRLPSISTGDSFKQPNLEGISISQIERIEILPATASGIYGGGATGGVINIILKRDYSGIDLDASYGNTWDGAVGQYRVAMNGGFSLDNGRTRVLFSASRANAGVLQSSRRSAARRGEQLQLRNDPTNPTVLLGGANICATQDGTTCSAQPLQLKTGASLASPFTSVPGGYAGAAGDGGAALAARAGQIQFDNASVPIWSAPETTTFTFNPRHEFANGVEAYVDFAHDTSINRLTMPTQTLEAVPAGAAANPFQQDVLSYLTVPDGAVQRQEVRNTRAYAGMIVRLPARWSGVLEYGWLHNTTSSDNSTALGAASPEADMTLQGAVFRDIVTAPLADPRALFSYFRQNGDSGNTLKTLSLRLSGPIVKLPGGDLTAAALLERRHEAGDDSVNASEIAGEPTFYWTPASHRQVDAQYLELRAPLVSPGNALPFVNTLELMASVRHDAYRTDYSGSAIPVDNADGPFPGQTASVNRFDSTTHTLGLRFAPTADVMMRASVGTGFLPPDLGQIRSEAPTPFSSDLIALLDLRDPARGNALIPGPITVLGGGSPSLQPEASRSTSVGFVLTPRILHGTRISVDYTQIRKTDEVTTLPLNYFIDNEAAFPGRVVRGPSTGGQPGPITQIDASSVNLAGSRLRALDIQAEYDTFSQATGDWRFHVAGTHTMELSRRVLTDGAAVDRAGFSDGPLKWRANFGIDWSKDAWSAGWNAQYYDSYRVCRSTLSAFSCDQWEQWQGASKVPRQIYHDAYVRYVFGNPRGILKGADVGLAVANLFDNAGPAIASGIANVLGPTSNIDPRGRRFTLSLHKHF